MARRIDGARFPQRRDAMIRPIVTSSEDWLARHRDTHARHPQFGTHRHPYLLELIEGLLKSAPGREKPSLLDYGCGKGAFLRELAATGWFRFVRGYDPAVQAFKARPAQKYDWVLCLDVLDQVEEHYVEPVIEDVAQYVQGVALFDVITVQTPALAHLNPRRASEWERLIGARMRIERTILRPATEEELRQGACPERTIVIARLQ
jgi:2-polyprenyl-3-methyl-5-hydroxy-6-metoxy-1,4-benzoquinol methylase